MGVLKELWLLSRMYRMLDRAEKQYLKAAWEQRDGQHILADAFTASAERFEARYRFYETEYHRVRDRRGPARPGVTS
ncbi:hypothetical protein ACWGJ9_09220 [Curtobacterium citreum]